jgi:hypothetical protein
MADSLLDQIHSQIRDRARELKPAVLASARLTAALTALDSLGAAQPANRRAAPKLARKRKPRPSRPDSGRRSPGTRAPRGANRAAVLDVPVGDRREAAREVLAQLDRCVPGWLESAAVGGEAGYLVAAEAVLRALVDAEGSQYPRSALSQVELLRALGDAKPLGATATDVLGRMRRERLITRRHERGDEPWFAAAPAGRQFLHRDTSARDDAWAVRDPLALLDLLYADGQGGREAFLVGRVPPPPATMTSHFLDRSHR